MYDLPEGMWQDWQRKRRHTLIGLVLIGSSIGIDCSVVFSTLFLYLRDLMKAPRSEMWYGLIISFFFVASVVFGVVCGRWLDRTRKLRSYANITLIVQIVGFLIYIIHWHPMFLLVGRAICGISDPFPGVVSGELFRIYDGKDATVAMVALSSVYAIGFMIGPALNFLFTGIDFHIGSIHVNNLNFIGIFMPCWLILCLLVTNILIHDCSRIFDFKEYLRTHQHDGAGENKAETLSLQEDHVDLDDPIKNKMSMENNNPILDSIDDDDGAKESTSLIQTDLREESIPITTVIRSLLSNHDTLLILAATVFFMYGIFAVSALVPLLVTVTLQWGLSHLSVVYLSGGILELLLLFTLGKCVRTNHSIYLMCLLSIISQILNCCVLIAIKVSHRHFERDVFFIVIFSVTLTLGYSFDDVMIKVVFAKMIPSSIQSFSESVRTGLSRVSIIAGCFTVAVVLPWAHWWCVVIMVIYVIILIGFILRRQHLLHPQQIKLVGSDTVERKCYGSTYA